jgi:hypothetical protein
LRRVAAVVGNVHREDAGLRLEHLSGEVAGVVTAVP